MLSYCLSNLNDKNVLTIFLKMQILHMFTSKSKQSFLRPWDSWTLFFFLQINNVMWIIAFQTPLGGNRFFTCKSNITSKKNSCLQLCIFKFPNLFSVSCSIRILGFELSSEVLLSTLTLKGVVPFWSLPKDTKFQHTGGVLFSKLVSWG